MHKTREYVIDHQGHLEGYRSSSPLPVLPEAWNATDRIHHLHLKWVLLKEDGAKSIRCLNLHRPDPINRSKDARNSQGYFLRPFDNPTMHFRLGHKFRLQVYLFADHR